MTLNDLHAHTRSVARPVNDLERPSRSHDVFVAAAFTQCIMISLSIQYITRVAATVAATVAAVCTVHNNSSD